MNFADDV